MAQVDYIKQIQTKVNRRIRTINKDFGVSKQQIRDVYSQIVKNPVQPTTKEITQVTELLAKQFTVTEKTIELDLAAGTENPHITSALSNQNQEATTIEITPADTSNLWETPPPNGITQTETEPSSELTITQTGETNRNLPTHQPTVEAGITQTEVNQAITQTEVNQAITQTEITQAITQIEITQAISQAVRQIGESGNTEAVQLLTSLAAELSSDITDTQEMVAALVSAYLGKRQTILSSAIGTLNTLRLAQTESFQSGLNNDFFDQKSRSKRQFLTQIEAMFN